MFTLKRWTSLISIAALLLGMTTPVLADTGATRMPVEEPEAVGAEPALLQFTAGGQILGFTPQAAWLASGRHALRVGFEGANRVKPTSDTPTTRGGPATSLSRVTYTDLWNGISLTYEGADGGVAKSIYHLAPGANPAQIRLRYNVPVHLQDDGTLSLDFRNGRMTKSAPVAWQVVGGRRVPVDVAFEVCEQSVGFRVGDYDPRYPLVIIPIYYWHTFYGNGLRVYGRAITTDGDGNVYVAAYSQATWDGPAGEPPLHPYSGNGDITVLKLDSDGTYQWHTFYGSNGEDTCSSETAIITDGDGNVYVAGMSYATWNGDGGIGPLHSHSGDFDIFVLKLNNTGAYRWHTFYGSNNRELHAAIAADGVGNLYVTAASLVTWNGPAGEGPLHPHSGSYDIAVLKLDSTGAYQWHTFYGSSSDDHRGSIISDSSGNVYVVGDGWDTWNGPAGESPLHPYSGSRDMTVLKLNSAGGYQWHAFYGSSNDDFGMGIIVDGDGDIYVAGSSYDTWNGDGGSSPLHPHSGGNGDITVFKLNNDGAYQWHTFYGSSGSELGHAIALDGSGNVYVAGQSSAWNGPGGEAPLHPHSGNADITVLNLDSAGSYQWHTFYGSSSPDAGNGITVDGDGNVYVVGDSQATWNGDGGNSPLHPHSGGYSDIVVLRLGPPPSPDVAIDKQVLPATAEPGAAVTYTLTFSNPGTATATGVVLTDTIPVSVTNTSVISTSDVAITARAGTRYIWDVDDLAPGAGGVITVTGVLSEPLAACTFANTATITTTAADGDPANNEGTAGLTVQNVAPVSDAGSDQNVAPGATVTLNGAASSDANGDALTYGWRQTGGASIALSDSTAQAPTFTAPITAYMTLTFTLTVTDTGGLNDSDSVMVTVNNAAPLAEDDTDTVAEDSTDNAITVLANDSDANNDNLVVHTLETPDQGGAAVNGGDVVTYTPAADFFGAETFAYTVADGHGGFDTATVTITVTNVNDAPEIDPIPNQTIEEGDVLTVPVTATDVESDTLTFSLVDAPPGGSIDSATGDLSWATDETDGPAAHWLTVQVTDDGSPVLTDTATFTVTVNEVNRAPQAADDRYTMSEEQVLAVGATGVLSNDVDLDIPANPLTASLDVGPTRGELAFQPDGTFAYTPTNEVADYEAAFTYVLSDGALTDTATVSISVTADNDAPVADAGLHQSVDPGTLVTLDGRGSFDPETEPLTYTWAQVGGPTVSLSDPTAVTPTFTTAVTHTVLTFTLTVADPGGLASAADMVTITVEANRIYLPLVIRNANARDATGASRARLGQLVAHYPHWCCDRCSGRELHPSRRTAMKTAGASVAGCLW